MAPRNPRIEDDLSSEDEINVDKMIATKEELNKVLNQKPCLVFPLLWAFINFSLKSNFSDSQRPRGKARPIAEGLRDQSGQPSPTHEADGRGSYPAAVSSPPQNGR